MNTVFDPAAWREILLSALSEMGTDVVAFFPNLVGALLILVVGWVISRAVEAIGLRVLRGLGVDRVATRMKIADFLVRADVRMTLSQIGARLLFWLLLLVFLLSSIDVLGLTAVTTTIDRLIAFIPGVFGAILIALGGLVIARFAGSAVSSAASATGLANAARIGFAVQLLVGGLVLVVAVEQLGVETDILMLPFVVLLATAGLSAGLAFALGARPVMTHILAGHFLRQSLPTDRLVEIEGRKGRIQRVGPIDTLLSNDDETWSVPNARLLELTVGH